MCNNHKGLCLYLLMGLNIYLGLLMMMDGATSISTILLVDVKVESFPPYKSVPTSWTKHIKTTIRAAPSLGNLSCSKLYNFVSTYHVTISQLRQLPRRLFRPSRLSPAKTTTCQSVGYSRLMRAEQACRCPSSIPP
jgi:hypothetical protein